MPRMRQVLTWAVVGLLAGCASPLPLPAPAADIVESTRGDYRAYVQAWMGRQPVKAEALRDGSMPSDAFSLTVSSAAEGYLQIKELVGAFDRWCGRSAGVSRLQDAVLDKSSEMRRCEAGRTGGPERQRIALMRLYRGEEAPGRHEIVVQHWYAADLAKLVQEAEAKKADTLAREAADTERLKREQRSKDLLELDRLATSARLKPPATCLPFERESNALRARFTSPLEQAALTRYLSDLTVSLDACANARPSPAPQLLRVYHFNMSSFQLFNDAWDRKLLPCDLDGRCRVDDRSSPLSVQRDLANLQSRYPVIALSPPERPGDILNRIQRFSLDR